MEQAAEFPDIQVVEHAEQFLETAELLLRNAPRVQAPAALASNAALAIELFLKSLDSHWELHPLGDEFGHDAFAITTKPNALTKSNQPRTDRKDAHDLRQFFANLPKEIKEELEKAFQVHRLATACASLESLLDVYAKTFVRQRYLFEHQADEHCRPVCEIVELARFFRSFIEQMRVIRT